MSPQTEHSTLHNPKTMLRVLDAHNTTVIQARALPEGWTPWLPSIPTHGVFSISQAQTLQHLDEQIHQAQRTLNQLLSEQESHLQDLEQRQIEAQQEGFAHGFQQWTQIIQSIEAQKQTELEDAKQRFETIAKELLTHWFQHKAQQEGSFIADRLQEILRQRLEKSDTLKIHYDAYCEKIAFELRDKARKQGWELQCSLEPDVQGILIDHPRGRLAFNPERIVHSACAQTQEASP